MIALLFSAGNAWVTGTQLGVRAALDRSVRTSVLVAMDTTGAHGLALYHIPPLRHYTS